MYDMKISRQANRSVLGKGYLSTSRSVFRAKRAPNTNAEIETASTKSVLQAADRGSLPTFGLTRLNDR